MSKQFEWMQDNRSAVAIVRVSHNRQKNDLSFRETQQSEIETYCAFYGLNLVRTFKLVESAKDSDNRKQFADAEEWADRNAARHRLYYMSDREARNLTDIERNEKRILRDEITIHHVQERKIYWAGSSDSDMFLRDVQGVTNKHYSRIIRTKVNLAFKQKCETGWFPGNHPPLGYVQQKLKDQSGQELKRGTIIVPDPNSKKIRQVQREFELRGHNRLTLEQIADQLVTEGFILPSQRRNYESSIERRLKNKFYSGYFHWPKNGPEYRGKHELFISQRLFQAVQETFGQNKLYRKKTGVFSGGWLKCADPQCGCHITYDPKTKTNRTTGEKHEYHLYRCSNGKRVHATFKGMYVHEEVIWEQFGGAVDSISITEQFASELKDALNQTRQKMIEATKREIEAFKQGLVELEGAEDEAYEDLRKAILDDEGYRRRIKRVREKRSEFTAMMEQKQHAITDAGFETVESTIELAKQAKTLWLSRSPDERREFLEMILSNQVLNGPTLRYTLKKPFAVLAEMSKKDEWRPLRDSNSCLLRERELS